MRKETASPKMIKTKLRPFGWVILVVLMVLILVTYFAFDKDIERGAVSSRADPFFVDDNMETVNSDQTRLNRFQGKKIVHIDLKGAPPKVPYFRKIFPLFKKLGINGVLMEYEDMFPYSGELKSIPALNAYTSDDIQEINNLAIENNLAVIPLIQTFGHLEFVLKLYEYKDLREVEQYPQAICPSNNRSMAVLTQMIHQIMYAHPSSKMIHIGCDEVYHLGVCNNCYNRIVKSSWNKINLFLDHVITVARIVKRKRNVQVLIWDDMLRDVDINLLRTSQIDKHVVPVVWKYNREVYDYLGPDILDKYVSVFPKLWIASAFKGATGSNQYTSETLHYVENHRSWMRVISEYKKSTRFEGVFITGWQRYDHFAILCELLPVSIPSLAMCLRLLQGYNDSPIIPPTEVAVVLGCDRPYALIGPSFGNPKCTFPGAEILEGALNLRKLREEYTTIVEESRVLGWMNDFNVKHTFSSPMYIEGVTKNLDRMRSELGQIATSMAYAMFDVYDNYTINEWLDTYLRPLEKDFGDLWEKKEILCSKDVWPRRPVNINDTKVT